MPARSLHLRRARHRPEPLRPGQPTDAQIARIDALTAAGRTNHLAFVLVTTLGVEDVDFFVDTRQTELPLVGVSIPTFSFFVFAPVLGAALYAYLHLHIRKVSEALAAPSPGDPPLEERVRPWLLNDFILRQRRDGAIRPRPLDRLAALTTLLLVWWSGPLVLAIMWQRTWPAHVFWLSLLCAACLMAAVYAGTLSWSKMRGDIGHEAVPRATFATLGVVAACVPVGWLTLINSKGIGSLGLEQHPRTGYFDTSRGEQIRIGVRNAVVSLDRMDAPDLVGWRASSLPLDLADMEGALFRYRRNYCEQKEMDDDVCGLVSWNDAPSAAVTGARESWCRETGQEECTEFFEDFEEGFSVAWTDYRTSLIGEIPKPDLARRDIRHAQLEGGSLVGINLEGARLDDAFMLKANLEGANLEGASLERAFLVSSRLQRTAFGGASVAASNLSGAVMHDANFHIADLTGADLSNARIGRTVFVSAEMQDASLFAADIRWSDFQLAKMHRAMLRAARIETTSFLGADLSEADFEAVRTTATFLGGTDLRSTIWTQASLSATIMHHADLRGAQGLDEETLSGTLGDDRTLLPTEPDPQTGRPLYVTTCWVEEPRGWDLLVAYYDTKDYAEEERVRELFLCAPGEVPRKTGTPWPLDQPPPWETDPDWQPEDRGPVEVAQPAE